MLCAAFVAWVPTVQAQTATAQAPVTQRPLSGDAIRHAHEAGQATPATPGAAPADESTLDEVHTTSRIVWHGFGDAGWQKSNLPGAADTFSIGQLTLYPTATISDRLSVLTEIVLKEGGTNRVTVDLERILLRYSFAEALALSVGRYHTAIGYYNTAYHHSSWLQTTIERPLPFSFKGPLPIHDVGVSARGTFTLAAGSLEYAAEIGNGRSSSDYEGSYTVVQNYHDDNTSKAINLAVAVMPKASPNLRMGLSVYRDTTTPIDAPRRNESIIAAYVVYTNPVFEVLNEAFAMQHGMRGTRGTTSPAFYSQISRAFGQWRPYARFEYLDIRTAIPLGVPSGRMTTSLAGVRFDFSELAALKLEYGRRRISPTVVGDGFAANVSFAF